jgi:hypothetical protein
MKSDIFLILTLTLRSSFEMALFNPHGLDIDEFANPKFAEFTAVTGVFDTAKGKARIGRDHAVNEDAAGFEFIDEAILFVRVVSPCG